jgi:hypothetical protein
MKGFCSIVSSTPQAFSGATFKKSSFWKFYVNQVYLKKQVLFYGQEP